MLEPGRAVAACEAILLRAGPKRAVGRGVLLLCAGVSVRAVVGTYSGQHSGQVKRDGLPVPF